jgi:hypothetical protein
MTQVELDVLEEEVNTAKSTFDLSALTAQILARVAAHSKTSADQLKDQRGGLPAIANKIRGDETNPVYLVTDPSQPLNVKFDRETAAIFANFAEMICKFVDMNKNVQCLIKAVEQLQEVYGKHNHHIPKTGVNTGHPLPVFRPISFDPKQSSSSGKAD